MDRVRAGLTGLAAVFLVTAAAALLFAPDEAERAFADRQVPGEPLAQLGVAPGSDPGTGPGEERGSAGKAAEPEPVEPASEAQPSSGLSEEREARDLALPSPALTSPYPVRDQPVAI